MKIKRFRDLTLIKHTEDKYLVIACDSCGGIGAKSQDVLKVPFEVVGYYTTRVALMEVLSVGAKVVTVINTLAVEMNPSGKEIIKGIQSLLKEAEIDMTCLNGSTEENFPTCQTGIGITVIGEVEEANIKANTSHKEDCIIALGIPKVGGELKIPFDEEICSIEDLKDLIKIKEIKEIYPVGSKGILYEADCLAKANNFHLKIFEDQELDLKKSAGPATVVVFTINKEALPIVKERIKKPLRVIGKLIEEDEKRPNT
ncbi:MAG: alpha-ribazole-5-phosphate synthase [Clostridiaceae bacterium]|nr:alpha-ribazole-5-phosphate synthase [Clostridiaceae bacterium]